MLQFFLQKHLSSFLVRISQLQWRKPPFLLSRFRWRFFNFHIPHHLPVLIIVRKVFKRFPCFTQGNTDMLDNLMDFSPRDKNKLIFSSSTTTIQDSLSIYKWVHIGAKINVKCLENLNSYYQMSHSLERETENGFAYIFIFELKSQVRVPSTNCLLMKTRKPQEIEKVFVFV